ncbi:MAG: DUF4878 domain-containing protein [Bacteroidales bacterium]|nr:DUF4878 domain-containing protein [Bacteroidales bacterium]
MKRVLTLLALAAVVLVSSCKGGGNSTKLSGPEAAAKAALEAVKKGDMKAFVNTFNLSDDDKATLTALMEDKLTKELDKKGGIKSYEFVDTNIDGDKAAVKVKIYYNNDTEEESTFKFTNVDGKWMQEMDK